MHSRRAQDGFTLIEAMIALTLMAILATLAVPSFNDATLSSRLRASANNLAASAHLARSEAIKRNADISLVPVETSWTKGWNIPHPTVAGEKLQAHAALTAATVTGPDTLTYTSAGRVRDDANPKFTVTASNGNMRCIVVDLSGRPSIKTTNPC